MIASKELLPYNAKEENKEQTLLLSLSQSFFDCAFEIIFRTSCSSDQVVFGNPLFLKTFGLSLDGKSFGFAAPDLFENVDDYWRLKKKVQNDHLISHVSANFKGLDGKKIVAFLNAQSHTHQNELIIDWLVLDISERVEFESNLDKKNIQLAKINSQMEKFLYSTSHDLRSPLTSIMGMVNLLRLESADKTVLEYAGKIEQCAMKLDYIIRDIINFSKTTYKNVHSELINLETLIWKIVHAHYHEPNYKRLNINVTVTGDSLFYSDLDRVEIILDNVIRNAIQFSDLNKTKPFINISVKLQPDSASIEVHDNGIGIARQYFESVFNMFYKATIHSKGAGLGLHIAKEGAEQLGGKITLESEIGFGSVFYILIPNSAKGRLINKKRNLEKKT